MNRVEAFDADEHAANLTDWQQEYDQISAGNFYGSITELPLGDLQVFHEYTSQTLHQRCNVWPDSLWLGIAAKPEEESRINGIEIGRNDLMCRPGDREFELMTPEAHHIYGIVVREQALREMARIQGIDLNWMELTAHERLTLPEGTMNALRFLLYRLLREPSVMPASRLQHDIVMMALMELLEKENPRVEPASSHARRHRLVAQVRHYLGQHHDQPVTITELCSQVGASRRSLQYAFESILGISPIQYLRTARLNGARRALQQASPTQTVADIAADWGFWHLSQFAKDYGMLFAEKPSQTLARRAG